jgi:hypothetical protein
VAAAEIFGDGDVALPANRDQIVDRRAFGEPLDAKI